MSLTKVSYSMITGAPVNVLDYGVTGDGTTDDKAAIQAALDASAGKTVYFPSGTYRISGSLFINDSMNLVFDPAAVITVTAPYVYIIAFEIAYNGAVDNVTIDGATFDFDNVATSGYGIGVRVLDLATNVTIRNCTFKNFAQSSSVGNGGDGIYIRLDQSDAPQNINVQDCVFENIGRNGISVTDYINGLNITNCTFNDCKMFGIDLEPDTGANNQQRNIYINECSFYECGDNSNSYYSNSTGGLQAVTSGTFLIFDNLNVNNCDFYFKDVVNNSYEIQPFNINMFTNIIVSGCTITNETTGQDVFCYLEQTTNTSHMAIVENCFFNNTTLRTFLSNQCTIISNRFEGDDAYLYIGNGSAFDFKVTDNTFYNCGTNTSTYVLYCASTFVLIDSNQFHDYRGAIYQPSNVISLVSATKDGNNVISNNLAAGTWSGYFVYSYDGATSTHNDRNKVTDNKVVNCGLVSTLLAEGWTVDANTCDVYGSTAVIFDTASNCSITNNHLIDCGTNVSTIRVNTGAGGIYVAGNSIVSTLSGTNRPTYAISAASATSNASYFLGNFSRNTQSGFSIAGTEGTSTNNTAL